MRTTIALTILLCFAAGGARAIDVADNSPQSISDAIASAPTEPGGATTVIQLKPGVSHWPPSGGEGGSGSTLNISTANTRPVTIQGAGVLAGGTEIINNGSGTAITWNVADDPTPASGPFMLTRITGVRFTAGSANWRMIIQGHNDKNSRFRMDHCRWEMPSENWVADWIGLMDHVDFIRKTAGPMLRPAHSLWSGGAHGNKSWQEPINWNSDQFIYIEDCNIYSDGTNGSLDSGAGFYDATSAARVIVRHCNLYHGVLLTHGNDTGNSIPDSSRGVVAMGVFANHFYSMFLKSNPGQISPLGDLRSGVQIGYGNRRHQTVNANQGGGFGALKNYRQYGWSFPFGGADGNPSNKGGQYDNNDQTNTTTPKAQNATQLHVVSVAGSTITVGTTLTGTTSPGWTANVWAPTGANPNPNPTPATVRTATYYIINKRLEAASSNGNQATDTGLNYWAGVIDSNTDKQITFKPGAFNNNLAVVFAANDEVEIRKINTLMDGCGMHGDASATAMLGNPAANPPTVTKGYNSGESTQIVIPCYYWDNYVWNDSGAGSIGARIDGTNFALNSSREGTHFINLSGSSTNAEAGHWSGSVPPAQTTDAQGNIHGFTEYTYPHPMQAGASFTTTAATFTVGASNSFLVTTDGFRGTPTISIVSWTGPTPSNVNFGTPNCAAATFCGTASGNNPGDTFTANMIAAFTDGQGNQLAQTAFTLNMALANTAPSWPGGSFTATPTSGTEPLTVALAAAPTDNGGVVKVEFYRDGNLINTDTTSAFAYSDPSLAAGTYSYTAKAYDGASPQLSTLSSPVSVTVSPAGASPTPPAILQIRP